MKNTATALLLAAWFLSGCGLIFRTHANATDIPTEVPSQTPVPLVPTSTPAPSATTTRLVTPTPDFSAVGLPTEPSGSVVFDFVQQMCNAQWSNRGQYDLPCPGNDHQQNSGYVMNFPADQQGLPEGLGVLLTFPPSDHYGTLFGKYPSFTVQKGDRFRAVLECRAHAFCDVEFGLQYYDARGQTGLKHWTYLFADAPIVVDYPLDGIAGLSVQFGLSAAVMGNPPDAYAVWVAPHIFRPAP